MSREFFFCDKMEENGSFCANKVGFQTEKAEMFTSTAYPAYSQVDVQVSWTMIDFSNGRLGFSRS
jgi:hypothetical protein